MPRYGRKYISSPDEVITSQDNLFVKPGGLNTFPVISKNESDFVNLLNNNSLLGIDFEFNTKKIKGKEYYDPTIIAVSSSELTAGCRYTKELAWACVRYIERGGRFVAYSTLGADKPVLEQPLGITTPLEGWHDALLIHYYANQALTKTTAKEESADAGALGYMGLFTAASVVTDLPNWKSCSGLSCYSEKRVCPVHDPIAYCAVDSWAGLTIYLEQWKKLKKFNFSYDFYRSKMELGEICTTMQTNGVKIDTRYVKEFDEKGEQKKELLFDFDLKPATKRAQKELERLQIPLTLTPEELRDYTQKHLDDWQLDEDDFVRAYKHFNPRSPQETIRYFKEHGIDLSATDKKYLQKKLEQITVSRGLDSISEIDDPDNVPEHLINLYNLWMLKNEGKGIKAWFGPQYVDEYDYAHPRWLYTGASSGRLSSSGPNFMNIPARGFGEQLRKAVIPRDPSLELYKADKSQLELRMVLHCAGVDQKILGPDAFVALVEQSGDDFYKAAKAYDPVKYEKDPRTAARNIAKVFSHSNSYLIGIKIIPYNELDSPRIKRDIDSGILAVYRKKHIPWLERDWEYGGGVVAFTGKHLAETAYGADTKENRKRALEMQENVYFKNDRWGVRRWQMKLLEFIETHGYVQHSCGSFLELYSSPVEAAKIAAGFIGQGQSAHYMQELMLNYRALGIMPLLQVHDELVFEQVKGRSNEEVKEFFGPMRAPSKLFDGFSAPIEIKRGPNWKDLQLVGKI